MGGALAPPRTRPTQSQTAHTAHAPCTAAGSPMAPMADPGGIHQTQRTQESAPVSSMRLAEHKCCHTPIAHKCAVDIEIIAYVWPLKVRGLI